MGTPHRSTARSWRDLVKEGRRLARGLSQHQWALGDLALEVEPVGDHGGAPRGVQEDLQRFAEEIDVEPATLVQYRFVASKWPTKFRRLKSSWSAHQALAGQEDRFELMASRSPWTAKAARDFVTDRSGRAPTGDPTSPGHDDGAVGPGVEWVEVDRALRDEFAVEREIRDRALARLLPLWESR